MDSQPRVFVVQEPLMMSKKTGDVVRKFDISPAKQYGDIVYLLDWTTMKDANDYKEIEENIRRKLTSFQFNSEDFILPTGDPAAMLMVGVVASEISGGKVQVLRWNQDRYYEIVNIGG